MQGFHRNTSTRGFGGSKKTGSLFNKRNEKAYTLPTLPEGYPARPAKLVRDHAQPTAECGVSPQLVMERRIECGYSHSQTARRYPVAPRYRTTRQHQNQRNMAIRTLTPLTDPNETFRIRNRPDRKAKVVKDSMLPYQIRTRAQVASILGLTDKRIQQIEQSA